MGKIRELPISLRAALCKPAAPSAHSALRGSVIAGNLRLARRMQQQDAILDMSELGPSQIRRTLIERYGADALGVSVIRNVIKDGKRSLRSEELDPEAVEAVRVRMDATGVLVKEERLMRVGRMLEQGFDVGRRAASESVRIEAKEKYLQWKLLVGESLHTDKFYSRKQSGEIKVSHLVHLYDVPREERLSCLDAYYDKHDIECSSEARLKIVDKYAYKK
jgi:hypothetical protein